MALYSSAIHFGTRKLFNRKPLTTLIISGARRDDSNSDVTANTVSIPLAVAIFMLSAPSGWSTAAIEEEEVAVEVEEGVKKVEEKGKRKKKGVGRKGISGSK
jgi:hypothetical protein